MAAPRGELGPGDRLGPYRIVRRIGAGGMGAVFEAVDEILDRPVALKVIAPALAGSPDFRARFTAEARAMAALDSPHVVQVHAHGEIDGIVFLATQLVPDGDVARLVRDHGPPDRRLAVELAAQVADALAEAHRVGLLHRDIKPANVLLRSRGETWSAYLADFGLAGPVGAGSDGAGTPAYLAPEVRAGGPSSVASDVYAAGCLLWAMLSGSPPVPGGPVPRLAGRRSTRAVNRILARTLAGDPAKRYADALALRDDLRAAAAPAGRPVGAYAAAAAALIALAALSVLTVLGSWSPSARSRAVPPAGSVAPLAAQLRRAAHLDRPAARCVAHRLVAEHGDARSTDDVFDATARCLWQAPSEVTGR